MQLTLSTSPDAWGNSLLRCLVRAFDAMGGAVIVDSTGENLIRARRTTDPVGYGHIVEAQGVPNLVHEFVHAYRHGRLECDSGFDYGKIPLNPVRCGDRLDLWDEVSACVISCDWLPPLATEDPTAVGKSAPFTGRSSEGCTRNASPAQSQTISTCAEQRTRQQHLIRVGAWFAEQVEILPVFYGLEDNFRGFVDLVDEFVVRRYADYLAFETQTRARLTAALAHFGRRDMLVELPEPIGFQLLWNRYLAETRKQCPL